MDVDKSLLIQKQVKDNSEDLQGEVLDMKNWEEQMKRKDEELRREHNYQESFPPIRSKKKTKLQKTDAQQKEKDTKTKKIKSYDYSAWDKFDADKACEEIDKEDQSDESVEEVMCKEELEKNHDEAVKHKERGNKYVQQEKWNEAMAAYSEAIKIFPYDAVFYANRALCHLKMDNLYCVEADCSTAVQLDETYVKAYHRRATARISLKQYKEAKEDLDKILKLEPNNKETKSLLSHVEKILEVHKPLIISGEDITEETSIEKKIGEKIWTNEKNAHKNECKDTEVQEDKKGEVPENKKAKVPGDKKGGIQEERKDKVNENKNDNQDLNEQKEHFCIPEWLPEKDNVAIVEPIIKQPHLRSKKPMTKIPVQEIEFGMIKCKKPETEDVCMENKCTSSSKVINVDIATDNIREKDSSTHIAIKEEEIQHDDIPAIPKTAVQFLRDWRSNKSLEFRYKYLKQLQFSSLPKIFQDSMESDVFSEILAVLQYEFMKREDPIFQFLKDFSQIKRFNALIMFISNPTKEGLKSLFEYCKAVENKTEEEVSELRHKYEV